MNSKQDRYDRSLFARRQWLQQFGMGIGAIALQQMLAEDPLRAEPPVLKDKPHRDLLPRATHFAPRAKAMISLFQHGGPSHMDLTDPKPRQRCAPLLQLLLSRQWQLPPPGVVAKSQWLRSGLIWCLDVGHGAALHQVHRRRCRLLSPSLCVELVQPLLRLVNHIRSLSSSGCGRW